MTPERWRQVEAIYESALQVEAAKRAAHLDGACGADLGLRREVESMLACAAGAEGFLEAPAVAMVAGDAAGASSAGSARSLAGRSLSHYQVLEKIGEGGMGVVYKARDSRLDRLVAIKVLPAERVADPERKRRFVQEAKSASALNHPNIVTVHGIDQSDGVDFIAMEYVEGRTLDALIGRKGLKASEALKYAIQIADALAKAHFAGIVHRDLKPANAMVTEDGRVKVLDFGLAKLTETIANRQDETRTADQSTEPGVIVGTAAYMSPEQAEGKKVDARSDIFSFGAMLYEMLTARRAFKRDTPSLTLAAILHMEPEPLPEEMPGDLHKLIARCLRKDPERRFQHMADVRVALEELKEESESGALAPAAVRRPARPSRRLYVAWAVAIIFAAAFAAVAIVHFRTPPAPFPVVRFEIGPPEGTRFAQAFGGPSHALISPDGRRIVFSAVSADGKSQLWVRSLDALAAQPLAGTENGVAQCWSPDSRSIAFTFAAGGKLKRIDATGGPALTLADAGGPRGATWNNDGVIVFYPAGGAKGLLRVSSAGGAASPATKFDASRGEGTHRFPWFLPDGRHFLYEADSKGAVDHVTVRLASLDSTESKVLMDANSNAIYAQGYLLFLRGTTLMAQPFDAKRLALTGAAAPLAENVLHAFNPSVSLGLFSASADGVLAYRAGADTGGKWLTWVDRGGKRLSTVGAVGPPGPMQLSPDLKSAAVSVTVGPNTDVWIYDLARGLRTRFTFDPALEHSPVWSPNGKSIVFTSNRKGHGDLYRKAADGSGAEEVLYADGVSKIPGSWSPDGKFLLYTANDPKTPGELWVLPLARGAKPYRLAQTQFADASGQFSPDGRWVAYESRESGRSEIYVIPFHSEGAAAGGKRQVSAAGGFLARWRRDGKELYYVRPGEKLVAVDVDARSGSFEPGKETVLFGGVAQGFGHLYDVAADGKSFLAELYPEQTTSTEPITVVQNWAAGLKK